MMHLCHCGAPHDDDSFARIERALDHLKEGQQKIMTTQENIDADVAAIQAVVADLPEAVANVAAEVQSLKDQIAALGTPVDTSGLDAAVLALQGAQAGVDALETPAVPTEGDGSAPVDAGDAAAE